MPIFNYKAIDKKQNTVNGLIEASSEDAAAENLQEKGFIIITLKKAADKRAARKQIILSRVSGKDLVIFSRQFAVMISANVTVVQALKILIEQTASVKLKMAISDIAFEVDAGSRLSESLAKRSDIFSDFYSSVIKSGETSGKLDESLNYLANEMEKEYDMMSKIKGAMIYPAFVFSGMGAVGMVMMIYVIPKLTSVLAESGGELPLATRVLIGVSNFLSSFWWLIILLAAGAVGGVIFALRTPMGKRFFDNLILRIPIFGKLFQRIYIVRFANSLHTLIAGGVTLNEGLKVSADVVNNKVYQDLIKETIKEVEEGNSISSVFVKSDKVPHIVSQMMSIGERTGKLDLVLERISDFYSREISNIIANLMSLMEPVILVVMGIAVGIMVAAVILPMYNMASQF
jgi:type IV pilus assembly protein PilC